jgi:hypothetical protein
MEQDMQFQNIYITSDEEIKEGDWCYDDFLKSVFQANSIMGVKTQNTSKKIILTTDADLIDEGVQPIDDNFLEWFVKNPNCEEVYIFNQDVYSMGKWDRRYKIIIPQEEPKPAMLEEAAEKFANDCTLVSDAAAYEAFIAGAKRQQERSYSEEEVLQLLLRLQQTESYDNLYSWFEQFKKK